MALYLSKKIEGNIIVIWYYEIFLEYDTLKLGRNKSRKLIYLLELEIWTKILIALLFYILQQTNISFIPYDLVHEVSCN